jgi:ABC-type sugar transport system ATPase subunit
MDQSMPAHAVRMEGMTRTFGAKMALDGAVLRLRRGEILGLVGDNGAGKSTLLKILSGALRPDAGKIFIRDRSVAIPSPRHARDLGVEMVYQDLALCSSMTIWENVFLGRYLARSARGGWSPFLDKRRMAARAQEALRDLGIDLGDVTRSVRTLSGGEQQAVALCRCTLFRPDIVLLDEPTASMAEWEKNKVLDLARTLRDGGSSVIMVTHNLPEVFRMADRVLVLKEGRSVWCGSLDGLDPETLAQMMFLGKAEAASPSAVHAPPAGRRD